MGLFNSCTPCLSKIDMSEKPLLPKAAKTEEHEPTGSSETGSHLLGIVCGVLSAVGLAGSSICVQLLQGINTLRKDSPLHCISSSQ